MRSLITTAFLILISLDLLSPSDHASAQSAEKQIKAFVLEKIVDYKSGKSNPENPGFIERTIPFSEKNQQTKVYYKSTLDDTRQTRHHKAFYKIGPLDNPKEILLAYDVKSNINFPKFPKVIFPGQKISVPVTWSASGSLGCGNGSVGPSNFSIHSYETRNDREEIVSKARLRFKSVVLTKDERKQVCKQKTSISKQLSGSSELVLEQSDLEPPATHLRLRISTSEMERHYVYARKPVDVEQAEETALSTDNVTEETEKDRNTNIIEFSLLDANPLYVGRGENFDNNLKPSDLLTAKIIRNGASADGISQLIVKIEVDQNAPVTVNVLGNGNGSLEPLLGGETITFDNRHYAFALYTPPKVFDQIKPIPKSLIAEKRIAKTLEVRDVFFSVHSDNGSSLEPKMILARPPVVLVHGLFSDPIQTWVNAFPDGVGMAKHLENEGFLPFLVNYQNTNGSERNDERIFNSDKRPGSSFAENRNVVWDSPLIDYEPFKYEASFLFGAPDIEPHMPVGTKIGGIKQAVGYYRDELNLAATQAIVIGHSMGGLLARVWTSDGYNSSYLRPENFMKGDLNRILTLNTPHHGSELVELKDALIKARFDKASWSQWARLNLINSAIGWFLEPEPGAISDLRPGSTALRRIGVSEVPAYAIATKAGSAEFGARNKDPLQLYNALYSFAGMVFFNYRPLLDEFIESRFRRWENTAEGFRKSTDWQGENNFDFADEDNRQVYKRTMAQALDANIEYWAVNREADYVNELKQVVGNTVILEPGILSPGMGNDGELELISPAMLAGNLMSGGDFSRSFNDNKTKDVPETFLANLRDLVFHQDPLTDGAVRVVSQQGGLGEDHHETLEAGVAHSYSPWDKNVQERVTTLLKTEIGSFSEGGFPEAGQLTPRYMPTAKFANARVTGQEAITWSGMVPSHAEQYLKIADERNVIILARPVNSSSTQLLKDNAAAKGMNVKGKSSNWGPQIGYIPFDQKYSKLWRIIKDADRRDEQIEKYNKETKESTTTFHPEKSDRTYAVTRGLVKQTVYGECTVVTDPDIEDAESSIFFNCGDKFYDWHNATHDNKAVFDPKGDLREVSVDFARGKNLLDNPLLVLADDTSDLEVRPYLTADYDLLAIGFPFDTDQCSLSTALKPNGYPNCRPGETVGVQKSEFDSLRGFISPRQWTVVEAINKAVEQVTGYTGGLVTHHGPENQYAKSPYVDYPVLVFDPTGNDPAQAYLIRQGPPGFRDIHLKRFFTEKNQIGYNLWPNPHKKAGWRWEARRPFDMERGYDPRDASDLPPYVDEIPRPKQDGAASPGSNDKAPSEDINKLIVAENSDSIPVSAQEENYWLATKIVETPDAFANYLEKYPDGKYVGQAKEMLVQLQSTGGNSLSMPPTRKTNQCDKLAASRWDIRNKTGININRWQLKNHRDLAEDICRAAVLQDPDDLQNQFQLFLTLIDQRATEAEAIALLEQISAKKYPTAMALLGAEYMNGYLVEKDTVKGKMLLEEAAALGDDLAELGLADFYLTDKEDDLKINEGIAFIKNEWEAGNDMAAMVLANIYSGNHLGRMDLVSAELYYTYAIDAGVSDAVLALANLYGDSEGELFDPKEAIKLYNKATQLGYRHSSLKIEALEAKLREQELKDNKLADIDPYDRSQEQATCNVLAADIDDPQNTSGHGLTGTQLYDLGNTYILSALEVCHAERALDANNLQTKYQIARLLTFVDGDNDESFEKGKKQLLLLATQNYSAAQNELGIIYEVYDNDLEAAAIMYEAASENKNYTGMSHFARMVLRKKVFPEKTDLALELLNESLEAGNWRAHLLQSTLYYIGQTVPIDDKKSAEYSIEAIQLGGSEEAISTIATRYEKWGSGYRQELQKALRSAGVYNGRIDGESKEETIVAINKLVGGQIKSDQATISQPDKLPNEEEAKLEPTTPTEKPEDVWGVIQNTSSIAVLEEFIKLYPSSIYARLAKSRIDELK